MATLNGMTIKYRSDYVPEHGTKAAWHWHKAMNQTPCEPCQKAFQAYWVEMNKLDRRKGGKRASEYGAYHEPYNRQDVLAKYGTICHLCGYPIDIHISRKIGQEGWERSLHVDHIIPLSKGGEDTIRNVRPSHAKCNMLKGATLNG